ncbi:hypothetical protein VFPFJ_00612 [Purpureocillium lilacinum]|uniref:Uncharacterized protein n=1 Tax=Purpureocillium lilacinum TaxID=33203 RepID=A0A179HAJ6_PURLI|nr:hypothetical protein VFPFJ_00612 [Purpureocillium lilacinum]OAQ86541.1 hypothetical protein VFPBJ_00581 [Purpureocillium lilacinum]OAQ94503.1 hypothetical protein VFPFJ_00612 [Purpureocillium lilacinum]
MRRQLYAPTFGNDPVHELLACPVYTAPSPCLRIRYFPSSPTDSLKQTCPPPSMFMGSGLMLPVSPPRMPRVFSTNSTTSDTMTDDAL